MQRANTGVFSAIPRTANHWWAASGVEARSLLKLYGIRFDILVTGQVKFRAGEGRVCEGLEGQPQPERFIPGLSGREVCAHPHGHHTGHGSSLAGRGEFNHLRFSLAAVTTSQSLLAPTGSAYCFLGGGLAGGGRAS